MHPNILEEYQVLGWANLATSISKDEGDGVGRHVCCY
jgi:hypothetical protein